MSFVCVECDKGYSYVSGLRRHLKVAHKLLYHTRGSPTPVPLDKLSHVEKQAKKDGRGGRQRRQENSTLSASITIEDAVSDAVLSDLIADLARLPPIPSEGVNPGAMIYEDISNDSESSGNISCILDVISTWDDEGETLDFTSLVPVSLQDLNTPCVSPLIMIPDFPKPELVHAPEEEPRIAMMSIPGFTPILRHVDNRHQRVVPSPRFIPAAGAVLPGGLTYRELREEIIRNTSRTVPDILLEVERKSPIEVDDSEIVTLSYVVRGILEGLGCAEVSD